MSSNGTGDLGNGYPGVWLGDANTVVGGVGPNEANVIAWNGWAGIKSFGPVNARGNSIHSNRVYNYPQFGLGIEQGGYGPDPNDSLDTDGLQNHPDLTYAVRQGTSIRVAGTLQSRPNTTFWIDFYLNSVCDPHGYGEGQTYAGSLEVVTDASGNASFVNAFPATGNNTVAATATSVDRGTSEFSPCKPDPMRRVSLGWDSLQADDFSCCPVISGDGREVVFLSDAGLEIGDNYGWGDVYTRNIDAATTEWISTAGGTPGIGHSALSPPSISTDGRYVAFHSEASQLVPNDTNRFCDGSGGGTYSDNCGDIFVRDRNNDTTVRASVATGSGEANYFSSSPAISGNGRYVSFWSWADNLVSGDTHLCQGPGFQYNCGEVFLRDLQAGTTERISVDSNEAQSNGDSFLSAINADGRYGVLLRGLKPGAGR